ncbi:MAG: TIGR02099 family protein [Pseudomonadota bacterium]|nr:TIGR02099 family protein [Pseudomonadota bacterium]
MTIRKVGKVLSLCFAGLLVLVLLLMLALKLALDRAPSYQAQIKEWVHAQTGYRINFAHVSPAFRWYGPELYFDRLELRSKDDQRVLARAAGGRVAADIWQLIRSGKLLAGRIEVDSPSIDVKRLGPHRFAVASEIELGGEDSSLGKLTLDDLPAGKIAIRHAVLTLQNWNPELPQLILQDVDVDARRDAHELVLDFSALLPAVLGGTVTFKASARGGGDVQTLAWDALARVRDISFPGWHQMLPEYLGNLDAGIGAFEVAAVGHGAVLSRADADFGAINVVTHLPESPIAKFDQMSGALTLVHTGDRWNLTGKRVRVGHRDPESAFDVNWQEGETGLLNVHTHADYLRIETLLPLTGFLPQKDLRERLREIAPSGEWTDTSFALERDRVDDPWRMQVQAKFQHAGYASVDGVPGIRGIAGSIAGNERGGQVIIDTNVGVLHWPAQFHQPVELERLKVNLYWKRTAQELLIASPDWEAKTRDGDIRGQMAWHQPDDGSSPRLTLVSTIQNGNVASARNYLPRALIAPSALAWLDRALVAGRLVRASALFQGPVRSFPFREGGGIFLARCTLQGMTLDYSDGWPAAENVAVNVEFRNEGMSAHLSAAHIGELALESGDARFPDFSNGELKIRAGVRGDAASALTYLRATPLDAIAEHAFSGVEAKGPLRATVELFLPFKDFEHRQVLIYGHLAGASLNTPGSATMATDVTGDFDIDGGHVTRADIHGQLLGGGFQMQARTARNRLINRTQLELRGTMSADAVRTALSIPASIAISGQTDWRAVLKITPEPARERSLRISSTLVGFDLNLPAPLDKAASAPLPSWFEIQWPAVGGPQGTFTVGSLLSGSYALESDPGGMRLAHASMTFGASEAGTGESQILNVGGSVQRLDLGGWLHLSAPGKDSKPLSYYMRTARLNVAELDYLGLAFRDVALDLAVAERSWRINVGGRNVIGAITIPSATGSAEPWNIQFDRLRFDVANSGDSNGSGGANISTDADPRAVPAVNFHATELVWGERQFGDVTATLTQQDFGVNLKSLSVVGPSFTVGAQGEWRAKDAGVSRIKGTLASTDVQSTLKDLGYADVIQAKAGKMEFDLTWEGAPTAAALAQVIGHVQLSLENGQVTGIKPGAGRVLGLASIAALPRRLALDFSDLTDKGLAFDTVHGDFDLRDGNAYTENVLLKGPAAEIGLIGRVGLKNKDYDQTAVVTGSVGNSLSIPVASALVGGPVVGAAVLLFTQVFKQPLKGLARGYYRITGSWDNPTVERIKSADAAAATAEAPK